MKLHDELVDDLGILFVASLGDVTRGMKLAGDLTHGTYKAGKRLLGLGKPRKCRKCGGLR
jgi:hypothetical protein